MKKCLLLILLVVSFLTLNIFADAAHAQQATNDNSASTSLALKVNNKTDKNVDLWIEKKGRGALKQWIAVVPGENNLDLTMIGFENLKPNDVFVIQEAHVVGMKSSGKGDDLVAKLPLLKGTDINVKKFIIEKCLDTGRCQVTVSDDMNSSEAKSQPQK